MFNTSNMLSITDYRLVMHRHLNIDRSLSADRCTLLFLLSMFTRWTLDRINSTRESHWRSLIARGAFEIDTYS